MKKENFEIKAIIFDIGGVLSLSKHSKPLKAGVHEFVAKKLKISLDQYFDSIDTAYAKSITGEISEKKMLEIFSKNLKTKPKKLIKIYKKAYNKYFKLNKELYKFAFKLKKQGYKIAILSDQWHLSVKSKKLINKKYLERFDVVMISCYEKLRKPNPKIYKLLLKKLKVPAKSCVFIDNQKWNLEPAKKLGIKPVLFKTNKQLFKHLEKVGVRK